MGYSFSPRTGWRDVVLDPYDFSVMSKGRDFGARNGHRTNDDALQYARGAYGRIESDARKSGTPMPLDSSRFKSSTGAFDFNGKLGQAQLQWLGDSLKNATLANERVILLC